MSKTIKWGSDFSGVGAADYALKRLSERKGFNVETVYACDWDKYARVTYQAAHGTPPYYPKDVYEREIPKDSLDLYVTSPPCQAFSLAGKRLGKDDKRGILFFNSHEFIQENKPRFFIFENVKGLLSDDGGKTFQEWVNMLGGKSVNGVPILFPYEESVPYHLYWKVINAKHHGIPQNRERVFLIGIRDDQDNKFSFPVEEHLKLKLKDVLEEEVFEKYFLSENQVENIVNSDFNQERERIQEGDHSGTLLSRDYKSPKCVKVKSNLDKYYLSERMIDHLNNSERAKNLTNSEKKESADTITASYGKNNTDAEYLVVKSNLEKYYLSEKMIDGFMKHNEHHEEKGTGFIFSPKDGEDVANCLRANPAICATDNTIKVAYINQDTQASAVYDENGVAQTMTAGTHGYDMGYVQVSDENPSDRTNSSPTQQRLEINENGTSNKITTVQKDNVVIQLNESKESGGQQPYQQNRIFDENGISPAILANLGGDRNHNILNDYKIRRLTPIEAFRLMDFPDEIVHKAREQGMSDSQLYKQAGNSIVVRVLEKILEKLPL